MPKILHAFHDYGTTLLYEFTLKNYKTYETVTKSHFTFSC